MKKDTHKWLLRFVLSYVPTQNFVYICMLAFSDNVFETMTSLAYIYYIVSLQLIFTLANALRLCLLYKIGIINPLIAPILMLVTPHTWGAMISYICVFITFVLVLLLIIQWGYNKHKANRNVPA